VFAMMTVIVYIPSHPCTTLLFGKILVSAHPTSDSFVCIEFPNSFVIQDPETGFIGRTVRAKMGSSFLLEYNGQECEIKLGRKFKVFDAV